MRKGAVQITPPQVPENLNLTRALIAQLLQIAARVGKGQIGDEEMSDVSIAKLIGGTLTGDNEMIFDGEDVILKSSNFQKDQRRLVAPLISNLSPNLPITGANFTSADFGREVQGEGIAEGTTIAAVTSADLAVLSANPGAPGVNVVIYIPSRPAGAGWALYGDGKMEINAGGIFRGKIELAGFSIGEDGSVAIGVGDFKLTANQDGSFTWGTKGAIIGISPTGQFFVGGENFATAIASFDAAGNFVLKETSQTRHSIPASAIDWTVLAPTFDPAGGAFDTAVDVAILCQTPNVTIYYTTDGSPPTSGSTLYTGARIHLTADTTIKAIAYLGAVTSDVSSKDFTLNSAIVPNPTTDPVGGTYSPLGGTLNVDLACALAGASMRYTTDGSTPSDVDGTLISPPNGVTIPTATIQLAAGTRTLKVIAFKSGKTNSDVVTEVYEVTSGGGGTGGGGGGGRGNVP